MTGEPTHQEQLAALQALIPELGELDAHLIADAPRPYLVASTLAVYGERILVADRAGIRVYAWHGGITAHPARDPAGAARRVAASVQRRVRQTHGRL